MNNRFFYFMIILLGNNVHLLIIALKLNGRYSKNKKNKTTKLTVKLSELHFIFLCVNISKAKHIRNRILIYGHFSNINSNQSAHIQKKKPYINDEARVRDRKIN